MSTNPLNDISRVYLEQVAESAVPGKPAERLGAVTAIPKAERDAARERLLAKAKEKREKMSEAVKGSDPEMRKAASDERRSGDKRLSPSTGKGYADQQKQSISYMDKLTKKNKNVIGLVTKEALDPVGKEDADIDNDGDTDKSDKYLHKRRKAIAKSIAKEALDPVGKEDADIDNDGDTDKSDEYLKNRRKVRTKAITKEGFSNWREDLLEVMDDEKYEKKIKEKKVNNKIKINPNIQESIEEIGGTLLEMVEIDEFDFIVEGAYLELLDEGYSEDEVEDALEYALTEAKVTFGHDTSAKPEKKKASLLAAAKQKLAGVKKSAKAAVARGARKVAKGALGVARKMEGGKEAPKTAERKPSTYRGAGAGTKERVSSGSYQAPTTKKKAEKPADPWEGSATTPSKPKAKAAPKAKAPAKKKKKSKLDDLLASVRNEEVQIDEKTLTKMEMKKREEIVKSMKDKASDFEKRYPGRGKEVMYATATKMAKKIAEQALELQPKVEPKQTKEKPLDTNIERQKYANLKLMQQKQQQLQRQKLNLQKQGKLPLETD